jgi:hypothetical protein
LISRRAKYLIAVPGLLLASLFLPSQGVAQDAAPGSGTTRLSLQEIVANMAKTNAERAKDLEHYQGTREYQLDYKGFPTNLHAEMVVRVSYSAPSTVEFTEVSQSGSKLILNRVIKPIMETEQESIQPVNRARVQVTADNYNFTLLDPEDNGDGCPYVLGVEPKVPNKFLFRGKIWVDARDFAVCRIEAEPAKNPSFWIKSTAIHHSFMKIGDFWLPAENRSASNIRLGGHAILTIKYEDYQVQGAPGLQAVASVPSGKTPN